MRQVLLEVQARFRIPVILIIHDPEDVNPLAQTLVVYDRGRVQRQVSGGDFSREPWGKGGVMPVARASCPCQNGLENRPARS